MQQHSPWDGAGVAVVGGVWSDDGWKQIGEQKAAKKKKKNTWDKWLCRGAS